MALLRVVGGVWNNGMLTIIATFSFFLIWVCVCVYQFTLPSLSSLLSYDSYAPIHCRCPQSTMYLCLVLLSTIWVIRSNQQWLSLDTDDNRRDSVTLMIKHGSKSFAAGGSEGNGATLSQVRVSLDMMEVS